VPLGGHSTKLLVGVNKKAASRHLIALLTISYLNHPMSPQGVAWIIANVFNFTLYPIKNIIVNIK